MKLAGFPVGVRNVSKLGPIKERVGIPVAMGSCHTAEVGGYFVEGHVPAEDVKRLLAEHPSGKGLTVPGMPMGFTRHGERVRKDTAVRRVPRGQGWHGLRVRPSRR